MKPTHLIVIGASLAMATAACAAETVVDNDVLIPPKIIRTTSGELPSTIDGNVPTQGTVELVMSIGSDGMLNDALVVACSHPTLGEAALDTVKRWRYEPAQQRGGPVPCRINLTINYQSGVRVVSMNAAETVGMLVDRVRDAIGYERLVNAADLDHPLTAEVRPSPGFPAVMRQSGILSGSVVLDFYVDENGATRLPVIVSATEDAFAAAAAQALAHWRFAPPRSHDQPVIAHATQEFIFAYVEPTAD